MNEAILINRYFAQNKLSVQIARVVRGPAVYLGVLNVTGMRIRQLESRLPDIEALLTATRARRGVYVPALVRYDPEAVALEITRPDPKTLPWRWLRAKRPMTALLGERTTARGQTVVGWRLDNPATPHALVAGMTGSGKSNLLSVILLTLMASTPPSDLRIVVVDMKGDLASLYRAPHVSFYASTPDAAAEAIHAVHALMERRARSYAVLLVIDEAARLAMIDGQLGKKIRERLVDIAQIGRSRRVHLLAATQHPNDKAIAYLVKANLPARFVGAVGDAAASVTALGVANANAHKLPGRGAFLIRMAGRTQRIQAWRILPTDARAAVNKLLAAYGEEKENIFHGIPSLRQLNPQPKIVSAPAPAEQKSPSDLAEIFARYARGTHLRHGDGWLMAAATALNGGVRPSGNRYRTLRKQVLSEAAKHGYQIES